MTRKYSFEEKTIDGQRYVIAEAHGGQSEPIRVRADWVDSDDLEGEWEEIIKRILQQDTLEEINISEGNGGISRREAVESLANADSEDRTIVSSERQADVLLEYLAEEGVIEIDGDQIVLFRNPEENDGELPGPELMNWAALMSAVIEMIDQRLERFETAKEKFEETLNDLEEQRPESSDRLSEVGQRLQNLGPGQGVPTPEDLNEEQTQEYERLKRQFVFYKKMKEAREKNVFENVNVGKQEMADAINRLKEAQLTYKDFETDIRDAAFRTNAFPQEAMDFVKNAGDLIADMSNVGRVDETIEQMDEQEFRGMVESEMDIGEAAQEEAGKAKQAAETAEKAAGFER